MMLNVINTGSIGNGYVLHNDTEALVIECGCSFMEVKKVLNFNIKKIVGAVISHRHLD